MPDRERIDQVGGGCRALSRVPAYEGDRGEAEGDRGIEAEDEEAGPRGEQGDAPCGLEDRLPGTAGEVWASMIATPFGTLLFASPDLEGERRG
jgi:hypothetical protein